MTRITNFGRKRKYLEAGFAAEPSSTSNEHPTSEVKTADGTTPQSQADSVHPKKKRKGTKKPQADGGDEPKLGNSVPRGERDADQEEGPSAGQKKAKIMKKSRVARNVAISGYKKRTDQRRLKRIADRQADTVCFACRERGHAVKDCLKAAGESGDSQKNVTTTVGMCYRCGSTNHTLSRCNKPERPDTPLPFALCFVCSGKGHLASTCPQNKEKGIYPNGGSCILCGENTHLAKDCGLRRKDVSGTAATTIFGTGSGAGADEDDFHTFKRMNAEVSKDEKKEERRRKKLDVKAGSHAGTVKAFDKNQVSRKPKKVVYF